jgi:hypothetical protein
VCSKTPSKFIFIENGYSLRHFLEDMTFQKYKKLFTFQHFCDFFGKSLHFSFFDCTIDSFEILSHTTHPTMSCIQAICLVCEHQKTEFHHFRLRVQNKEKNEKILKIGLEHSFDIPKKSISDYIYNNIKSLFFRRRAIKNTIKLKSFDSLFVNFDITAITKHDMFSTGYLQAVTFLQ